MAAKATGGGTPAIAALRAAGIPFDLHAYAHDPSAGSFGLEAAEKLGADPQRVFKTLIADVDGRLVVGVVPVTAMLSLKALAHAVEGKRAAMADAVVAERKTGYVVGGISPLGQRTRLTIVVDASATRHETVFVSGGRRGLDLELSPADLVRATNGSLAPIAC